ncbi:YfhO family protein [bacterium]|nr:YfhO family protein [bacterium]
MPTSRKHSKKPLVKHLKGDYFSLLALFCLAIILMGKVFLGYAFLPADMLYHFQPWGETKMPEKDYQWNPLLWDSIAQFYPWRSFLGESLKKGFLPLWNPYQFCGTPFYANGQSAIFYPFNWLTAILGKMFMGINAFLHLFLAGFFLYLFLRKVNVSPFASLVASTSYMLSGFVTAWLPLPTVASSFVWAPLSLLAIELSFEGKLFKSFILSALSISLSALGGHPQYLLYTVWLFLIYIVLRLLWEKRVSLAQPFTPLIGAGIGLLLSSVSLLPLFEFSRLSHRAPTVDWSAYKAYISLSLPLERLLGLFLPNFFGNPANGNYWGAGEYIEYALYIGLIPLFFLPFAFKDKRKFALPLLIISLLSLLMMIGTPLNIPFYFLFPLWSKTGSPARLIAVFSLCLSILSGIGLENALTINISKRSILLVALAIIIFPFILFPLSVREEPFCMVRAVSPSFPYLDFSKLVAIPLILYLVFHFKKKMLPYILLPLLLFDLLPISLSHLYFTKKEDVFPRLEGIPKDGIYRIMAITPNWSLYRYPHACLPPNTPMLYRLFDVAGYDSLFLLYYKNFLDELEGKNSAPVENGNMLLPSSVKEENLRLLGVKYVISPIYIDAEHLRLIKAGETKVYIYKGNPLRFNLVDREFYPQGKLRLMSYEPNRAEFEIEAEKEGYFILNDTFYPGWKAYLDGKETKILPFHVFRSVSIPKGRHSLAFVFRPFIYKLSLYSTLLSLLLICSFISFKIFLTRR